MFLKALYLVGPLRCVMYTTPLSTLTSSLSLNHHLYADDTQLFSPSILATLTQVSPTSRPLCDRFPPGRPHICLLLTLLRLNCSLSVSNSNFLNQTTLHSIPLILHATFLLWKLLWKLERYISRSRRLKVDLERLLKVIQLLVGGQYVSNTA